MTWHYEEGDQLFATKGPVLQGLDFQSTVIKYEVVGFSTGKHTMFLRTQSGWIISLDSLGCTDSNPMLSTSLHKLGEMWDDAVERLKERETSNAANRCRLLDRLMTKGNIHKQEKSND